MCGGFFYILAWHTTCRLSVIICRLSVSMIKIKLIPFFLLFGLFGSFCQDFSKSSLFGGVGIGYSDNSRVDGSGTNWSIGYQGDIWKNRLRIVPGISFGTYTNKGTTDASDTYHNSTNLKVNLNFDILKIKTFSLLIGSGLTANYSSGLIGTGGFPPGRRFSEYFNESNFAFNGLIGLRLNPARHRIGYELLLLDGSSKLNGDFSELTLLRARVIMKLK